MGICERYRGTVCKKQQCCFECQERGECWEFNGVCNFLTKEDYTECEYKDKEGGKK